MKKGITVKYIKWRDAAFMLIRKKGSMSAEQMLERVQTKAGGVFRQAPSNARIASKVLRCDRRFEKRGYVEYTGISNPTNSKVILWGINNGDSLEDRVRGLIESSELEREWFFDENRDMIA